MTSTSGGAATPAAVRVKVSSGTTLLLALPVVLVVIGVALAIAISPVGAGIALIGLLLGGAEFLFGRRGRVADAIRGRDVNAEDEPRLFNLLDGLCVANGLPLPGVRLLADAAANAVVVPTAGGGSMFVCTTGLLDLLDRVELEGVVAHQLATIKRGEVARAARLTIATGWLCALAPSGGRLVHQLSEPGRRVLADDAAVVMTRYPPGLRSALSKIAEHSTVPEGLSPFVTRVTGPSWCVPIEDAGLPVRAGELDLELRIAALAER